MYFSKLIAHSFFITALLCSSTLYAQDIAPSVAPFKMGNYNTKSEPDSLVQVFFAEKNNVFQYAIEAGSLSFLQEGTWRLKGEKIYVKINRTQSNDPILNKKSPKIYIFKLTETANCLEFLPTPEQKDSHSDRIFCTSD